MSEKNSVLKQEEQLADEVLATRWLTPQNARFTKTPGGFVSLEQDGTIHERVLFFRTFPFTAPDKYLSVRREDDNNREIGIIADLQDFEEATRVMIEEQLDLRYFMPKIQRIYEIKEQYGYSYWFVSTDKGECRFTVDQNGVAKLSDTRLLISDIDGNRFELPNVTMLSAKELRMVDLYM